MAKAKAKMIFVGADVGFATSKGVVIAYDDEKDKGLIKSSFVFPSRVAQGRNQVKSITSLGRQSSEPINYKDETSGVEYTVVSNQKSENTRFDGYHTSALNRVLTQHLMQKLQVLKEVDADKINLATGLPIDMFFIGTEQNVDLIAAKEKSLKGNVVTSLDGFPTVKFDKITIVPEGIGAYLDYIIDVNGDVNEEFEQYKIAVIDIGGRTSDIFVGQNLFDIDFTRVRGRDIGVLDVLEDMRIYLQQNFKIREDSNARLEQMLYTGEYRYRGENLDRASVLACVNYGVKNTFSRLNTFVQQVLGTEANDIDQILVVGGGAHIFGQDLKSSYSTQVKLVEQPEISNARGFAKFALNVHKTK